MKAHLHGHQAARNRQVLTRIWISSTFIVFCLLGCKRGADGSAIGVWRSPTATPEERLRAVNSLVRIGTPPDEVRATLGDGGRWGHFHGQDIADSNRTHVDKWEIEFPTSGGAIVLTFQGQTNTPSGLGFAGAVYRRFLEVTPKESSRPAQ
jgi:hypothetical protein